MDANFIAKWNNPEREHRVNTIIHEWHENRQVQMDAIVDYGFGGVVTNPSHRGSYQDFLRAIPEFANIVAAWVSQYITASDQVIRLTAFAIVLVGVFLLLALIGKALEGIIKLVMLNWLNRILGMVFSAAKCILILGLLVTVFNSLNVTFGLVKPEVLSDSLLYSFIQNVSDIIFPYLKSLLTA